MASVALEIKFKVDFCLDRIAQRLYPPVFVVEEDTEAAPLVWGMEDQPYDVQVERARKAGIPVLDGLDVVHHLKGEMDPDDEWFLREEVMRITAAKQGMVIVDDEDPERLQLTGRMGEAPLTSKIVPVEELLETDVNQQWFLERLEDLTYDHPVAFTIPMTERVNRFLEDHARQ